MNNSLYDITNEYLQALDRLEIDEETGEVINADEFNGLAWAFNQKAESVACYIKNLSAFACNLRTEETVLAKRRKSVERKAEYLKSVLAVCLDAAGREVFESAKARVSFRKSSSVSIEDENALPDEFIAQIITTKPDKTAIKKAIQSGQEVPGASLTENRNIQIK